MHKGEARDDVQSDKQAKAWKNIIESQLEVEAKNGEVMKIHLKEEEKEGRMEGEREKNKHEGR